MRQCGSHPVAGALTPSKYSRLGLPKYPTLSKFGEGVSCEFRDPSMLERGSIVFDLQRLSTSLNFLEMDMNGEVLRVLLAHLPLLPKVAEPRPLAPGRAEWF